MAFGSNTAWNKHIFHELFLCLQCPLLAKHCSIPGKGEESGYSLIWAILVCAAPKDMVFSAVLVINRVRGFVQLAAHPYPIVFLGVPPPPGSIHQHLLVFESSHLLSVNVFCIKLINNSSSWSKWNWKQWQGFIIIPPFPGWVSTEEVC